jgi:hypothetical protein
VWLIGIGVSEQGLNEVITKETVFVLGAGASTCYGFPTGAALADRIIHKLRKPQDDFGRQIGITFSPIKEFPIKLLSTFPGAFIESGCSSLDEFVQSVGNRRFLPLVKAAMILELIACERPDKLFPDAGEKHIEARKPQDWNRYLFGYLRTPTPETFGQNRMKVVTFNFDRSFERQLFLMIRGTYGVSDDEAARLVGTIPILHIHGSLGGPRWLGKGRPDSRDYTPEATADQKRELLDKLTIIHEELAPTHHLEQAHRWLSEAHTICFLGFGFHPTNIKRLRMNQGYNNATVWGTALGLSEPELGRATALMPAPDGQTMQQYLRLFRDKDAFDLLRDTPVIQTD